MERPVFGRVDIVEVSRDEAHPFLMSYGTPITYDGGNYDTIFRQNFVDVGGSNLLTEPLSPNGAPVPLFHAMPDGGRLTLTEVEGQTLLLYRAHAEGTSVEQHAFAIGSHDDATLLGVSRTQGWTEGADEAGTAAFGNARYLVTLAAETGSGGPLRLVSSALDVDGSLGRVDHVRAPDGASEVAVVQQGDRALVFSGGSSYAVLGRDGSFGPNVPVTAAGFADLAQIQVVRTGGLDLLYTAAADGTLGGFVVRANGIVTPVALGVAEGGVVDIAAAEVRGRTVLMTLADTGSADEARLTLYEVAEDGSLGQRGMTTLPFEIGRYSEGGLILAVAGPTVIASLTGAVDTMPEWGTQGETEQIISLRLDGLVAEKPATNQDDRLTGTDRADFLEGLAGDDTLSGGDGDDRLLGRGGLDRIIGGDGDDAMFGGRGMDTLIGGDGDDLLLGGDAADRLAGGNGDDALFGEAGYDMLAGGNGDDTLDGGGGHDVLDGGGDHDSLLGGDGIDTLMGQTGDDTLNGGAGADRLDGGPGADILTGGAGADVFSFAQRDAVDTITDFQVGRDVIDMSGAAFFGDPSSDRYFFIEASGADDTLVTAKGIEILLLDVAPDEVNIADFQFDPLPVPFG